MKKIFKMIFNPDGKNMIPEDQDSIDYLILNGGIEVAGIDCQVGEFLYSFTPKIKDLMPELYEEHIRDVNSHILNLWEKGFLSINFMEDDPIVNISEKGLDPEEISKLPEENQWHLNEIKRLLRKK
jgi:hypothetical protein